MSYKACKEKGIKTVYVGELRRKLEERVKKHFYKNRIKGQRLEVFRHLE
jgi:hypothetical protein